MHASQVSSQILVYNDFSLHNLQVGFYPPDNRAPAQQGYGRAPAANEWEQYPRQGGAPAYQPQPGGPAAGQYAAAGASVARPGPAGGYNPASQQGAPGQYRPQTQPYQTASTAAPGGGYGRPNDAYYPEGPQNGAASLNSLKQTLAQTISNLTAAAGAAGGAPSSTAPAGYAPQTYDPYASSRATTAAPQQAYAHAQPHGAYNPSRRPLASASPAVQGGRYAPDASGARAPAGLVPLDVRYQAAAGAGAAPAAGGYPVRTDPPNTAGFYNRRPAQDPNPLGAPQGRCMVALLYSHIG